jgi:hypothetical protein
MNAIINPIATRAFTPVTAMPRYRPPMMFSDWNLDCPVTELPHAFCLPCDITRETEIRSGENERGRQLRRPETHNAAKRNMIA